MIARQITYKNAAVYYTVHGAGKAIVLVHGFAENGNVWANQVEYLSNFFKVIVPHLPGYGSSSPFIINPPDILIDDYANAVYNILLAEINACTIIGHSMGGYITLAIADKHPEILRSFGFVHSTAFADSEAKKEARLKGIEFIKKHGANAFVKNTIPGLFSSLYKQKNEGDVFGLMEEGKAISDETLQQSYYAMLKRPDRTDVLKRSKIPVFFIAGKEDAILPVSDILKQVALPEIAYFHVINNAGHMAMLETPGLVNEYLEIFLNETL